MDAAGRPTLRSVAEAAGVSIATVSLVLRGKGAIPAATADRVRDAAERLGYRPNRAAQAMKTGRTGIVLLSLTMVTDPWSVSVADAVGEAAARRGLVALTQGPKDWFETIAAVQPDVAYVDSPPPGRHTLTRLERLVERGQRTVVFSDELEPAGYDVVRSDGAPGVGLVLGAVLPHTDDVAYLRPLPAGGPSRTQGVRHRAYLDAVASGAVARDRTVDYDGSRTSAFRAALTLLTGPDRPGAVVANTDYAALAALAAAQYAGLRVPDDLLVAGLGNSREAADSTPSLTSAGPVDFFARQAALILDAAAARPGPGRLHPFSWHLHERASTARTAPHPREESA